MDRAEQAACLAPPRAGPGRRPRAGAPLAAWAPALMSLWLARRHVQRWRRLEMGLVRELLTSNGTLAVLLAMTSTDVLLARHLLTAHDAGAYAFAGLFGKVVFWGTQFVALAVVPSVADSAEGGRVRATLHRSSRSPAAAPSSTPSRSSCGSP